MANTHRLLMLRTEPHVAGFAGIAPTEARAEISGGHACCAELWGVLRARVRALQLSTRARVEPTRAAGRAAHRTIVRPMNPPSSW